MWMHIYMCVLIQLLHVSLFTGTLSSKHCVSMKYVSPFSVTSISLYYFQYIHTWVTFLVSLSLLLPFDFLIELSSAFSAITVLLSFPLFYYSLRQNKIAREEKGFFLSLFETPVIKLLELTNQLIDIC